MPNTKQPIRERRSFVHNRMIKDMDRNLLGMEAPSNARIRAAKGDYGVKKLGKLGLVHAIDMTDRNASARDQWQEQRLASDRTKTAPKSGPSKRYSSGGSVRGDGCCTKGKTKGRMR